MSTFGILCWLRRRGCFVAVAAVLVACSQVQAPDDAISKDALDIYSKTLTAMDDAASKPYAKSKRPQFYQQIQDQIQVLQLRAEASANSHDNAVAAQAAKLSDAFTRMEHLDKSGWGIDKAGREQAIELELNDIRTNIYAILKKQSLIKQTAAVSGT